MVACAVVRVSVDSGTKQHHEASISRSRKVLFVLLLGMQLSVLDALLRHRDVGFFVCVSMHVARVGRLTSPPDTSRLSLSRFY